MQLQTSVMFMWIAGSGKTTQSQLLSQKTQSICISAGKELKENKEMAEFLNHGHEVPYEYAYTWSHDLLLKYNWSPVILDGFFRSPGNFDAIKDIYPKLEIIYLPIHFQTALTRILKWNRWRHDDWDPDFIKYRMLFDLKKIQEISSNTSQLTCLETWWWIQDISQRLLRILSEKKIISPE